MRIAVLSDTHDSIYHLQLAIRECRCRGVTLVIHCGDLISPFMLQELDLFGGPVHLIYGNNVGDLHLISQLCANRFPAITHHGPMGAIEAGGRRIAFHHYPEVARGFAARGDFDIVCCGHNHLYHTETIGKTLFINPGELLGKDCPPTFCIVETNDLSHQRIEVGTMIPTLPPERGND